MGRAAAYLTAVSIAFTPQGQRRGGVVVAVVPSLGAILSEVDSDGPLSAALLLRRTGVVVETWTREPLAGDIVPVMAATMMASIDTICTSLGSCVPTSVSIETDGCRIFGTRVEPGSILVLVAPWGVSESYIRQVGRRIMSRLLSGSGRPARANLVLRP